MSIRALHIFPMFGEDLPNGSERYAWMLTRALAELGVEVDVFTTCSRSVRVKAGLSLDWENEYPRGVSPAEGFRIFRFPAWSMPAVLGRVAAWLLAWHVGRARKKLGPVPMDGSPDLAIYQRQIMATQSRWSDWLALLSRGPVSVPLLAAAWREMRHYDVILVSFFPLFLVPAVVRLAKMRNKPVVVLPLFHANDLPNNSRVLGDALMRADAVLAMTQHSAARLGRSWEVGAGVDPAGQADSISGTRFREKYGLQDRKIILFVGRKEEGKRYRAAMEAVNLVSDPTVILVMAGEDVDRLPVAADRVRYLGRISQEDLWDAYDACDVFLLPSRFESFGLVFLEAWLRGKPVIGDAGCPAVASLIEDSVDGFLCGEPGSIAERLDLLLADVSLRRTMGEAGRDKVLRKYTWDLVAQKVRSVYESCSHGL